MNPDSPKSAARGPLMEPPDSPRLARATGNAAHPPHAWSAFNRQQLQAWLQRAAAAPSQARRAAVFDWDGTSYAGDSAPLVFEHAIASLQLRLTPAQLAAALPGSSLTHLDGVDMAALRRDILDAYASLWPSMQTPEQRMHAFELPAYQDFRCKAAWLTRAYCARSEQPSITAYAWVLWLTGHSEANVQALARDACDTAQLLPPTARTWQCATPGAAGALTYLRELKSAARPELIDLMWALREAHVEVWLVSANLRPLVMGLAAHLNYPVPEARIIGSVCQLATDETLTGRVREDVIVPFMAGKSAAIRAAVQAPPVLVAGDTNGDANMLSDFPETQLKLVFDNRLPGPIAALYDAAATFKQQGGTPVVLLQAVCPHTGALLDAERSPEA